MSGLTLRWPTHPAVSRSGFAPALPLPYGTFSLDRWPRTYFDGDDAATRAWFEGASRRYWKARNEGDIFIEGPFAGLVAD